MIAERILSNGECIYKGYVDDPRNTDNSWMETQGEFSSGGTMRLILIIFYL